VTNVEEITVFLELKVLILSFSVISEARNILVTFISEARNILVTL